MVATARPQRVLLVHQYFAPDVTTYAQMLGIYAAHLAALGHDVTVVCGPPSYNGAYEGPPVPERESRDGYRIRRLPIPRASTRIGKLVASMAFPVAVTLFAWLRRRPFNVVSVTTIPPVAMGVAGRMAAARSRRSRFVYHCMDLYPEVARAIGVEPAGRLARISRFIDNRTVGAAEPTIVLSEDMRRTLAHRGADVASVTVANNFIMHPIEDPPARDGTDHPYRLVFAGNIGRFQGLDVVLDAVALLHERGAEIDVLFLGNGALVDEISQRRDADSLPIRLEPHRPIDEAAALMAAADLAIVSLAPRVIEAAYPSKTMMYLELGLPLLAAVEADSELAQLVHDRSLGVVPDELSATAVADAIEQAMQLDFDRDKIRDVGRELFGRDLVLDRWCCAYGLDAAS